MPSPRWRKVGRDIWLHRGRTALVVLAIATGLAGAGIILNAYALVGVATREGYGASNPASATLHVDSVDRTLLAQVTAVPDVRMAQARRTTYARVQVGGRAFTAVLFTVEDFRAIRIGVVAPGAGSWPPDEGGIVIERSSLEMSGASLGDVLRLSFGDGDPVPVTVRGIARDVGLAPGWMEHVVYGFVTPGTLARMGAPSSLNELQLVVGDGTFDQDEVRRVAYAVRRNLLDAGRRVTQVTVPVPGEHIHAAQMNSLLYTQGAFAAMALLLSAFLVVNLISALLVGQSREIGIMKTLGARWEQLAAMYLAIAAALGVAAVILAIPAALVGGRAYAAIKGDLLNFDIAAYGVPAEIVAMQVAVGILIPVVAAAVPVWIGCRSSVNDALRDVGIAPASGPGAWPLRITGLARPMLLSLRNAFRRRQRLVLTLATLSAGGAVFLGANNLRASVRGATELMFSAQHYDFSLRLADAQDPDEVERLVRQVDGVRAAEAWAGGTGTIDHGGGVLGNSFALTAPPATTRLLTVRLDSGRWFTPRDERVLVINRALQREEPSLAVGARTVVLLAGRAAEWTVIGIAEAGTSPAAFAPRAVLAPMVTAGRAASVVVAGAGDSEAVTLELIQRLRASLGEAGMPVASSQVLKESRRVVEDHLLMVVDFLGAVAWLMLLVGGVGLASTMGLAVLERTREIGVLRAIGARNSSILTLVQVEGLTIALLSWGIAIPCSVPISAVLATAFGRIMIRVPVTYVPQWSGVAWWLVLVTAVSAVACAWPATRAMRVPAATALAYE